MTPLLVFQSASGQPSKASNRSRKASAQPKPPRAPEMHSTKVLKYFEELSDAIKDRPHWSGQYSMSLHDCDASPDKGRSSISVITTQYLKAFDTSKCIQVCALITHRFNGVLTLAEFTQKS